MSKSKRIRIRPDPGTERDGWTDSAESEFESKLYQLLHASYQRADASAKAIARLEYELAKDLNVQQEDADESELNTEAAMREVGSEFDNSSFEFLFSNLNTIKLLDDLVTLLGLTDIRADIIGTVIEDKFRTSRHSVPSKQESAQHLIGTDAEVLLHNIKKLVERKQRSQGNGSAKA